MEITSTPAQRSSAYREALFTITANAAETIDLDILEQTQGLPLGKKRLSGQSTYTVNVSNYAQRLLDVTPLRSASTAFFYPEKRMASVRIQAGNQQAAVTLTSGLENILFFEKLSKTPDGTGIAPEQGDEIPLYTDISAMYAEIVLDPEGTKRRIRLAEKGKRTGLCALYLSMPHVARRMAELGWGTPEEYRTMELQLITEFDELALTRRYALEKAAPRTLRLCWWNRYGQIDYHTFKRTETTLNIDKQRIYSLQGYKTTGCRTETVHELVSDYLTEEGIQWLHELAAAPRVWIDDGQAFRPVEVLTRQVVMGGEALARLEISITPAQKTVYQHL